MLLLPRNNGRDHAVRCDAEVTAWQPWGKAEEQELLELAQEHTQVQRPAAHYLMQQGLHQQRAAPAGRRAGSDRAVLRGASTPGQQAARLLPSCRQDGGHGAPCPPLGLQLCIPPPTQPAHTHTIGPGPGGALMFSQSHRHPPTLVLQEDGRVKWSAVAAHLPGRTDKQCATRWKALTSG